MNPPPPPRSFPASHYRARLAKVPLFVNTHRCIFDVLSVYGADSITIVFSQWRYYKHLRAALVGLTGPKQNGRKSRHGISLAGNTAVTRGGDVRRKCPRQTVVSDGPGCSSLGFPIASLSCLSKRLKPTRTHHLWASTRVPVWNLNLVSSTLVTSKARLKRNW